MSITWKPAIWHSSTLLTLPTPVTTLEITDAFDMLRMKVPLHAGDFIEGRSENGVTIEITGAVGRKNGIVVPTEQAMLNALETLRQKLRPATAASNYQLFIYHDAAANTFRSFKSCTTLEIRYNLNDPHLFGYTLRVHAADPVLYVTAPT